MNIRLIIILLVIVCLLIPHTAAAQSQGDAVVRAVLFYSPTCPHCHMVINDVLVPMVEDYGDDQLQIIGIDTSQPAGGQIYLATIEQYEISSQRQGVPTLVIGEVVLVGSAEIPELFPELVEQGLKSGGIDWPDIPGLEQAIPPEAEDTPSRTAQPEPTATPASITTTVPTPGAAPTQMPIPTPASTPPALALGNEQVPEIEGEERPPDPLGFALAGLVLLGLVISFAYVAWRVINAWPHLFPPDGSRPVTAQSWAIPLLTLLGLGVAIYLAYVEINQVEAVCGPVGECNIVQSSPYARILGIPVAVLGILNYLAVIVLWAAQKALGGRWAHIAALGLLGLTLAGTLFSIYLTYLELLVIHAVCAWCLTSAIITALVMLLVALPITHRPIAREGN